MAFVAGDDFVGILILVFEFLMVTATLLWGSCEEELGHVFVELEGPEWMWNYLLFCLERVFSR